MKKILFTAIAAIGLTTINAQDSTKNTVDTLKVGDYVIIKKNAQNEPTKKKRTITFSSGSDDFFDISIDDNTKTKKNKNVSTNWIIFDLGFANISDRTNYAVAQQGSYFREVNGKKVDGNTMGLINEKTSNVNFWLFMQRINLSQHKLNFKWGLGIEMFNFRYQNSLSFRNDNGNFIFLDTVKFSKNKLFTNYLTVPLMLNYRSDPNKKSSFNFSAGVSVGYLINNYNKQISDARDLQKSRGSFDLEPFKFTFITEIGMGPIRFYGSYALNNMFQSKTGLDQTPFAFGARFSRW